MSDPGKRAGTARVFFALQPDPALRARLAALARELAPLTRGRAAPEDNIHMTVAFVGDVAFDALGTLESLLHALPDERFELVLDSVGAWRRAGVAWIAPSDVPPALSRLQAALSAALTGAGFNVDPRPFRPHLTLVRRCRRPLATAPCAALEWEVSALSLMRSENAGGGVRHCELARRDLAD
jgi:2'-5' RNA ligase